MIKAIFFDLDGTLLPLDMDNFLGQYFKRLAPYFADKIEPQLFIKELLSSTEAMIRNTGELSNEEVFMKNFLPAVNQDQETMYPLFEKFYAEEFPKLKEYAGHNALAQEIVGQALDKGYKIVLATNPVFPKMATQHRMKWAGIDQLSWEIVTTYENCTSCKPNPAYYLDLCKRLGLEPSQCLMVGNDAQEDMVASQIGMQTYLVTDWLIDRKDKEYPIDWQGSLEELKNFIGQLPPVV